MSEVDPITGNQFSIFSPISPTPAGLTVGDDGVISIQKSAEDEPIKARLYQARL